MSSDELAESLDKADRDLFLEETSKTRASRELELLKADEALESHQHKHPQAKDFFGGS